VLGQQVTGHGNCTLSGQMLDTTINQPVPNVPIVVRQQLSGGTTVLRSSSTLGAGQFAFTNLPPGTYMLFADGYVSAPQLSYTLTNQAALSGVTFKVNPIPLPYQPTNLPASINESSPAFALDSSGRPHLVWQRGEEIWHAYHDGTNWNATGSLPGAIGKPQLSVPAQM